MVMRGKEVWKKPDIRQPGDDTCHTFNGLLEKNVKMERRGGRKLNFMVRN